MMIDVGRLVCAFYDEHKQRTGHDVRKEGSLSTLRITCDVCLALDDLMKQAEMEYYVGMVDKNEGNKND